LIDKQLVELGVITDQKQKPASFSQLFREVWANNADAMSIQYSGTGALKTDYTRTGQRSLRGAIQDGINSLTRYYLNNFMDGTIQDSLDLFVGYYRPTKMQASPYDPKMKENERTQQASLFGFLLRLAAALFTVYIAAITLLPSSMAPFKRWSNTTQFFLLSTVFAVGSWKLSIRYGRRFVNRPKLVAHVVEDIIHTDKSMASKDTL
jgi:phosphatidylinositol 4-phosphatase